MVYTSHSYRLSSQESSCTPMDYGAYDNRNQQNIEKLDKLIKAIKQGDIDAVRQLAPGLECINTRRHFPIHEAFKNKRADCLKVLLENGFSVSGLDAEGDTVLHLMAIEYVDAKDEECIKLLLDASADIEGRNSDGLTPLQLAVDCGELENAKLLLSLGSKVDAVNDGAYNLLHISANADSIECMQYFARMDSVELDGKNIDGDTPLHIAAREGHSRCVQALLQLGASVTSCNKMDEQPLFVASQHGHAGIVKLLATFHSAPVNVVNMQGITALDVASKEGHDQVVAVLLSKSAEFRAEHRVFSPLREALLRGHTKVVEILVNEGAIIDIGRDGEEAFVKAAEMGHYKIVEILINKGIDVNCRDGLCLYRAVENGYSEIVDLLLSAGAKQLVYADTTLLFIASVRGYHNVVRLLLQNSQNTGTIVDVDDAFNKAVINGHDQVVECLLPHVADVDIAHDGITALYMAACNGHAKVVKQLLAAKADPNIVCVAYSPLYIAVTLQHTEIVSLLAAAGADVNMKVGDKTALYTAVELKFSDIVECLLISQANTAIRYAGKTPLHVAAETNNPQNVKLLLQHKARPNPVVSYGYSDSDMTPLLVAAKNGYVDVVKTLLQHDQKNFSGLESRWEGKTSLIFAAQGGHEVIAGLLVNAGAKVNYSVKNNGLCKMLGRHDAVTPLLVAVENGHQNIVDLLLQRNADIKTKHMDGVTALHIAAFRGLAAIVSNLMRKGKDECNIKWKGRTPLFLATENGCCNVVREFIEADKNGEACITDITEEGPQSPFQMAVRQRHHDIVRLFLGTKAATPINKVLGLYIASEHGDRAMVQLLVNAGADVNYRVHVNKTALCAAVDGGYADVVRVLIRAQADTNIIVRENSLLLHAAAQKGFAGVISCFLEERLDPNLVKINGDETLLHVASKYGQTDVVIKLLENNALVHTTRHSGETALHIAACRGHYEVVQLLIAEGANIDSKTNSGETPIYSAARYGQTEVVRLLMIEGANLDHTVMNKGRSPGTDIRSGFINLGSTQPFSTTPITTFMSALRIATHKGYTTVEFVLSNSELKKDNAYGKIMNEILQEIIKPRNEYPHNYTNTVKVKELHLVNKILNNVIKGKRFTDMHLPAIQPLASAVEFTPDDERALLDIISNRHIICMFPTDIKYVEYALTQFIQKAMCKQNFLQQIQGVYNTVDMKYVEQLFERLERRVLISSYDRSNLRDDYVRIRRANRDSCADHSRLSNMLDDSDEVDQSGYNRNVEVDSLSSLPTSPDLSQLSPGVLSVRDDSRSASVSTAASARGVRLLWSPDGGGGVPLETRFLS